MVLMCGRPVWSDRMQDTVGFEDSERLGKCHTDVEPPPFARVPHPVDIETVVSHAVDAGEWRVELLATIVFHARPIALHEPISPRRPRAMDVDHVVPFRRIDLRQEARFQDVANEGLANGYDHRLLQFVGWRRLGGASCPHPLLLSSHSFPVCALRLSSVLPFAPSWAAPVRAGFGFLLRNLAIALLAVSQHPGFFFLACHHCAE